MIPWQVRSGLFAGTKTCQRDQVLFYRSSGINSSVRRPMLKAFVRWLSMSGCLLPPDVLLHREYRTCVVLPMIIKASIQNVQSRSCFPCAVCVSLILISILGLASPAIGSAYRLGEIHERSCSIVPVPDHW